MKNRPTIKKKLSNYLLSEEGKISKQSLLTLGAFLATVTTLSSTQDVKAEDYGRFHDNDFSLTYSGGTATAIHNHHADHNSY